MNPVLSIVISIGKLIANFTGQAKLPPLFTIVYFTLYSLHVITCVIWVWLKSEIFSEREKLHWDFTVCMFNANTRAVRGRSSFLIIPRVLSVVYAVASLLIDNIRQLSVCVASFSFSNDLRVQE